MKSPFVAHSALAVARSRATSSPKALAVSDRRPLGFLLAWGGIQLLVAFGAGSLPRLDEVRLDIVTVAFTIGLTIVATAVFGVIPVLRLAPVAPTLHENGRSQSPTRGSHRARQFLMADRWRWRSSCSSRPGSWSAASRNCARSTPGSTRHRRSPSASGFLRDEYQTRQAAADAHYEHPRPAVCIPGCLDTHRRTTCPPLAAACYGNGLRVDGEVPGPNRPPVVRLFPRRGWRLYRSDGHATASRTQFVARTSTDVSRSSSSTKRSPTCTSRAGFIDQRVKSGTLPLSCRKHRG